MSPRPDVSAERRNQILDAAGAVFARLGFHDARMDDIVTEARLSKGALYWYFKSKDAIIAGLLERIFDRELAGIRELEGAEGTVSARLLAYTQRVTTTFERMQVLSAIAFEFYAVAARHTTVRAFLKGYFQTYRDTLARLIRQGSARGEFRPVDPDAAAVTLVALYEGLGLLWFLDPQSISLSEQAINGLAVLLAGLRRETTDD